MTDDTPKTPPVPPQEPPADVTPPAPPPDPAADGSPAAPPPQPPPTPDGSSAPPGDNRAIWIVLSYLGLLALIPLLVERDDQEVQWHAKHGLVLLVVAPVAPSQPNS